MRQTIYNIASFLWPTSSTEAVRLPVFQLPEDKKTAFLRQTETIMRRYHVMGASYALFDKGGVYAHAVYGKARTNVQVNAGTFFRVASVSKMITACCVLKMHEMGAVSLDEEIEGLFPQALTEGWTVTLRTMMSHLAGFHDGASYLSQVGTNVDLGVLMSSDNRLPSSLVGQWEYSNFGAGLIASVLESKTGVAFEALIQHYLFEPLGIRASFYPQHITGALADAFRMLPPAKAPAFNAAERQGRADTGWDKADPAHHYAMAQGNCCIDTMGAVRIAECLMVPGFLSSQTLDEMRKPLASFGKRDRRLRQGLGVFILDDPGIAPYALYGHQGLAYGAVHGIFYDVRRHSGMVFLSSGAALVRRGVMTDVNLSLIRMWQQWQR